LAQAIFWGTLHPLTIPTSRRHDEALQL